MIIWAAEVGSRSISLLLSGFLPLTHTLFLSVAPLLLSKCNEAAVTFCSDASLGYTGVRGAGEGVGDLLRRADEGSRICCVRFGWSICQLLSLDRLCPAEIPRWETHPIQERRILCWLCLQMVGLTNYSSFRPSPLCVCVCVLVTNQTCLPGAFSVLALKAPCPRTPLRS